jgi:hypothetical protein
MCRQSVTDGDGDGGGGGGYDDMMFRESPGGGGGSNILDLFAEVEASAGGGNEGVVGNSSAVGGGVNSSLAIHPTDKGGGWGTISTDRPHDVSGEGTVDAILGLFAEVESVRGPSFWDLGFHWFMCHVLDSLPAGTLLFSL